MILAFGYMTVGIELALSIVVGFLIGNWIDGKFDTQPWFGVFFGILGIVAGFKNLYLRAKQALREDEKEGEKIAAAEAEAAAGDEAAVVLDEPTTRKPDARDPETSERDG